MSILASQMIQIYFQIKNVSKNVIATSEIFLQNLKQRNSIRKM